MPTPARARGAQAVAANAACEGCHPDVAREWRGSLHQRAQVEATYQRAFAIEPLPFCQSCHAPEADPEGAVSPAVADLGVGCVTCHDTGGGVLSARVGGGPVAAPHPVARDARFAGGGACEGCHEFRFPGAAPVPGGPAGDFMQTTMREHAGSARAGTRCAECHLPRVGAPGREHRSHAFGASRDAETVRRAVAVSVTRPAPRRLRIELRPAWLGHAFPTGDLFRRLEVSAEAVGPDAMVLDGQTRYLTRHFDVTGHTPGRRRLLADDWVGVAGAEASVVELTLGEAAEGRPIAWRVAYQRVAHPRSVDERDAEIDGEIEIARGMEEAGR